MNNNDPDYDRRHAEALAEGYRDETCVHCGTFFAAHIHLIRCNWPACPMRSTTEPRTLLESIIADQDQHTLPTG